MTADSIRPYALIDAAVEHHKARLGEIEAQLETYRQLCGDDECTVLVLDTNIYDQYQMFNQIDWPGVMRAKRVRILVPLVVVDELDRQKDNRDGRLGKRAGKVIRAFRSLPYASGETGPRQVREKVELEFVPEPAGHVRRASNDDEIVRQASYLTSVAASRLKLVTGDLGMQIRAINADVMQVLLPDNYLISAELDGGES